MTFMGGLPLLLLALLAIKMCDGQTFQSLMTQYPSSTEFVPANPIELIDTLTGVSTFTACFNRCHMKLLCRVFVSDPASPSPCRLYEGTVDTGAIITSGSPTSRVGAIHYYPSLYADHQGACTSDKSAYDRYLLCVNGSLQCPMHTFWNGSMCVNDGYNMQACTTDDACRQEVGLGCDLGLNQCRCNSTRAWNGTSCGEWTFRSAVCSPSSFFDSPLRSSRFRCLCCRLWTVREWIFVALWWMLYGCNMHSKECFLLRMLARS